MEEVAWVYHWPPSELYALTMPQLLRWHAAASRIHREVHPGGG